jgi:hypothetical protein
VKDTTAPVLHETSPDFLREMLEAEPDAPLNLGAVPHEFYPVKEYYSKYPQFARHWLNEDVPTAHIYRETFTEQCMSFFNSMEIDIRDINVKIPVVRSQLWIAEEMSKRMKQKLGDM